jgi:hypothetical protein
MFEYGTEPCRKRSAAERFRVAPIGGKGPFFSNLVSALTVAHGLGYLD